MPEVQTIERSRESSSQITLEPDVLKRLRSVSILFGKDADQMGNTVIRTWLDNIATAGSRAKAPGVQKAGKAKKGAAGGT